MAFKDLFQIFSVSGDDSFARMIKACREGNLPAVREIVEQKREAVAAVDWYGLTGLHRAAGDANLPLASFLLDHGANPMAKSNANNTPLHYAAAGGSTDIIEMLIARGAAVDAANDDGKTPLVRAIEANQAACAMALIMKGANTKSRAVTSACKKASPEFAKQLDAAINTVQSEAIVLTLGEGAQQRVDTFKKPIHFKRPEAPVA